MKGDFRVLVWLPFFCMSAIFCNAQVALVATGNNGSSSSGTISYSVGQVAYTSSSASNISVNQGVQQPFEIFDLAGVVTQKTSKYNISLFPNPAENYITLTLDSLNVKELSFRIIDLSGKIMTQGVLIGPSTQIPVDRFAEGSYMVYILKRNELVHSFLLVKH